MNPMRLLPLALVVGLAGCEATTFQNPPVAEATCDPQLVGDWLSVPDSGSNDTPGEAELQVDNTCSLTMIDHKKDKVVRSDPTRLHVGHDGTQGYVWVDAAWAFHVAESSEPTPAGDFSVLRYSASDKELLLSMTSDRLIAHRIIDSELQGDIHKTEGMLLNRLTGTVTAEQLRSKVSFNDKPARFARHELESAK